MKGCCSRCGMCIKNKDKSAFLQQPVLQISYFGSENLQENAALIFQQTQYHIESFLRHQNESTQNPYKVSGDLADGGF